MIVNDALKSHLRKTFHVVPAYIILGALILRFAGMFTVRTELAIVMLLYGMAAGGVLFFSTIVESITYNVPIQLGWRDRWTAGLIAFGGRVARVCMAVYLPAVVANGIMSQEASYVPYPYDSDVAASIVRDLSAVPWRAPGTEVETFDDAVGSAKILLVDSSGTKLVMYGSIPPARRPTSLVEARYLVSIVRSHEQFGHQVTTRGGVETGRRNIPATVYTARVLDTQTEKLSYRTLIQPPVIAVGEYLGPGPDWVDERVLPEWFGIQATTVLAPSDLELRVIRLALLHPRTALQAIAFFGGVAILFFGSSIFLGLGSVYLKERKART